MTTRKKYQALKEGHMDMTRLLTTNHFLNDKTKIGNFLHLLKCNLPVDSDFAIPDYQASMETVNDFLNFDTTNIL